MKLRSLKTKEDAGATARCGKHRTSHGFPKSLAKNVWSLKIMTSTEDSPNGRSQDLTCLESDDKIVIDLKTFNQIFELICGSVDEISQARRREIFLFSLDYHLTQSQVFDDTARIQASLLLDAYYDFVPVSLAELDRNFQETWELMNKIKTNLIGGSN